MCLCINFLASYQNGWNVTVSNVNSSTIDVSWLPLNTSDIYGYVTVCLDNVTNDILVMNVENASSSNTVIRNLRPYTTYKVKVVALVRDGVTGETTLKSSKRIDIRTQEDGEDFLRNLFYLACTTFTYCFNLQHSM